MVKSDFTGKTYDPTRVCRIINMMQLAAYMEAGVPLLDLFISHDYKTNKPILVGIVDKKDSYEAYQKWCNHSLLEEPNEK